MPLVHGGSVQRPGNATSSFLRFLHTAGAHSHADYRSLDAVQPEGAGIQVSTGQVTSYAGATLLLAVWLVTGEATGCCTTGSTTTQGMVLWKNNPQ